MTFKIKIEAATAQEARDFLRLDAAHASQEEVLQLQAQLVQARAELAQARQEEQRAIASSELIQREVMQRLAAAQSMPALSAAPEVAYYAEQTRQAALPVTAEILTGGTPEYVDPRTMVMTAQRSPEQQKGLNPFSLVLIAVLGLAVGVRFVNPPLFQKAVEPIGHFLSPLLGREAPTPPNAPEAPKK